MASLMVVLFVLGYAAIACEARLQVNKAASALLAGVLCWAVLILNGDAGETVRRLMEHLGEIASILSSSSAPWRSSMSSTSMTASPSSRG